MLTLDVEVVQGEHNLYKPGLEAPPQTQLWQMLELALNAPNDDGTPSAHQALGRTPQEIINAVWEMFVSVERGKDERSEIPREQVTMPISYIVDQFKAKYLCFRLATADPEPAPPPPKKAKLEPQQDLSLDAMGSVMPSTSDLMLPTEVPEVVNPAQKVYNGLIQRLRRSNSGWVSNSPAFGKQNRVVEDTSSTEAEDVLHCLAHVLMNLSPKWEVLQASSSFLDHDSANPTVLFEGLKVEDTGYEGAHWSAETYQHWADTLSSSVLNRPCMKAATVAVLDSAAASLWSCINNQIRIVKRSRLPELVKTDEHQQIFGPPGQVGLGQVAPLGQVHPNDQSMIAMTSKLDTIEMNPSSPLSKLKFYKDVEEVLHSNEVYQVVNLTDLMVDMCQRRRQNMLSDAKQFGFQSIAVQMVEHDVPGNRMGRLAFAWRVPVEPTQRDQNHEHINQVTVQGILRAAFSAKPQQAICDESMEDDSNKKTFIGSNVRATVQCILCGKPRLVFAWAKEWKAHTTTLTKALQDIRYRCGDPLDCPDIGKMMVVKRSIRCEDAIQKLLYSQKNIPVPDVCYHCGSSEDVQRDAPLLQDYKCVFPQCKTCRARKVPVVKTHYKKKYKVPVSSNGPPMTHSGPNVSTNPDPYAQQPNTVFPSQLLQSPLEGPPSVQPPQLATSMSPPDPSLSTPSVVTQPPLAVPSL